MPVGTNLRNARQRCRCVPIGRSHSVSPCGLGQLLHEVRRRSDVPLVAKTDLFTDTSPNEQVAACTERYHSLLTLTTVLLLGIFAFVTFGSPDCNRLS